jgi:hypothetical protein
MVERLLKWLLVVLFGASDFKKIQTMSSRFAAQVLKKNHIRFEFSTQRKNLPEHKPRQVPAI